MPANEQQPLEVEAVETTTVAEGQEPSAPCPPAKSERKYRHTNGDLISQKQFNVRLAIGIVGLVLGVWMVISGYYG